MRKVMKSALPLILMMIMALGMMTVTASAADSTVKYTSEAGMSIAETESEMTLADASEEEAPDVKARTARARAVSDPFGIMNIFTGEGNETGMAERMLTVASCAVVFTLCFKLGGRIGKKRR